MVFQKFFVLLAQNLIKILSAGFIIGLFLFMLVGLLANQDESSGLIKAAKIPISLSNNSSSTSEITFLLKSAVLNADYSGGKVKNSDLNLFKKSLKLMPLENNLIGFTFKINSGSVNSVNLFRDLILEKLQDIQLNNSKFIITSKSDELISLENAISRIDNSCKELLEIKKITTTASPHYFSIITEISNCNDRLFTIVGQKERLRVEINELRVPPQLVGNVEIKSFKSYQYPLTILGFIFGVLITYLLILFKDSEDWF